MKNTFIRHLVIAFVGLGFGSLNLLAETPSISKDRKSKSTSRSRPVLKSVRYADNYSSKSTKTNASLDRTLSTSRTEESGFTNGVGSNPADHGITTNTATRPGDNGLNSGVGSSNDVKGTSVPVPPVNSADMNSKVGKGLTAAEEKRGR
ncbi:MAG: hypothetical protein JWO89_1042 [Verrucomicrobiaceae bacterium]|nr:hypothetical protein [Verrucomicrobiaceae bacterium]